MIRFPLSDPLAAVLISPAGIAAIAAFTELDCELRINSATRCVVRYSPNVVVGITPSMERYGSHAYLADDKSRLKLAWVRHVARLRAGHALFRKFR